MPTCNITTSVSATCPPISSVTIEIYALGTIDGYPVGTTAGTLLASGTANDDTFAVTDVLPQAWHITNATAVDIVSSLSGTYGSFDINQALLPEDIQICYTVTDGCGTSDQVCDTAWSCAAVPFSITSAVGVPGTEEGTWSTTDPVQSSLYGPGPHPIFREYDVTFSNGLTAHVRSDGTTANQMLWMWYPLDTSLPIIYRKMATGSNVFLSNGSNANSLWDNVSTEGAIVTWTFPQPVEKLSIFIEDLDGGGFGVADTITPEATHWQHTAGQGDGLGAGLGINPNGVYQYQPPVGDNDNDMYLYWNDPVTSVSMRIQERFTIRSEPTALYCEIPPEATEAVYVFQPEPCGPSIGQDIVEVDASNPASNQGGATWFDLSGNNNDFALLGGAVFGTEPISGVPALVLQDSNTYGEVLHNATMEVPDITAEAWIYVNVLDSGTGSRPWNVIATKWQGGNAEWHFGLYDATSPYTDFRLNLFTTSNPNMNGGTTFQAGQWYHVAFTHVNGCDATLYVNGVVDGVFNNVNRTVGTAISNDPLRIGDFRPNNFGMPGYMGYFRYHNTALPASEIWNSFQARRATYGI